MSRTLKSDKICKYVKNKWQKYIHEVKRLKRLKNAAKTIEVIEADGKASNIFAA